MLKNLCRLLFWFPVRRLILILPHRLTFFIASRLGRFYFRCARKRRRIMDEELGLLSPALDPARFKAWKKQSVVNFVLEQVEVMLYPTLRGKTVQKYVRIEGMEHLKKALEEDRGALILTAHFGSNQLIMPALASCGLKINQIAGRPFDWSKMVGKKPGLIEGLVLKTKTDLEASLPAKFHYISSSSSLRPLFRCLQNNEPLIAAFDGRAGERWTQIPLCERTANVSLGPALVAVRTGSPILPAFVVRESHTRHRLVIHEALRPEVAEGPEQGEDDEKDALAAAYLRAFARLFSTYLLARPEQYLWLLHVANIRSARDRYPLFTDYPAWEEP